MAIDLELARTVTADGHPLHGLLFRPRDADGGGTALLQIHGVASNFYAGVLAKVGQELAEAAGPERGAWHVVEGANHAYDGRIPALTDLTAGWLARVLA
jgi:hypothetical protein